MGLLAPGVFKHPPKTWAQRPSAALYAGEEIFITDAGFYGCLFRSDGTNWLPLGPIVYLDSPQASLTGSLVETTMATGATIPGALLGTKGQVEITSLWNYPNNANNKVLRVKFGGTIFSGVTKTTTLNDQLFTRISNLTANSQEGLTASSESAMGATASVNVTGTVDTTADVPIIFTGILGNVADTLILKSYIIKVFPRP